MGGRKSQKKKGKKMKPDRCRKSTKEIIEELDLNSDNIVRLKVTVRKGARIESVPLKKLKQLASKTRSYWRLEEGWLILYGFS